MRLRYSSFTALESKSRYTLRFDRMLFGSFSGFPATDSVVRGVVDDVGGLAAVVGGGVAVERSVTAGSGCFSLLAHPAARAATTRQMASRFIWGVSFLGVKPAWRPSWWASVPMRGPGRLRPRT